MVFNSLQFAIFFPIAVLGFFVMPKALRQAWLLLAGYVFYMAANPKYAVLLLFATAVTYAGALLIGRLSAAPLDAAPPGGGDCTGGIRGGSSDSHISHQKKAVLIVVFAMALAVLVVFKYLDFILTNINRVLGIFGIGALGVTFSFALPVGISFFTFQSLGYVVDVYRGDTAPEKNFITYALFVSFFPVLLSGPIERSGSLLRQIRSIKEKKLWDFDRVGAGIMLMLWGLFQKMVIADRLAIIADQVFDNCYMYETFALLVGMVAYTLQIYCDFASYSLIALGASKVLGFDIMENFNTPYFARSIREFWRRWHISLSGWFRDYLYIPLGGNRKGKFRKYLNLMITFLVSGLWHGAGWNYILWGGLHGVYQIAGDVLRPVKDRVNEKLHTKTEAFSYRFGQTAVTFLLTAFAWIFFRAGSVSEAFMYIRRMLTKWDPWSFFNGEIFNLGLDSLELFILAAGLIILLLVDLIKYYKKEFIDVFLKRQNLWFRWLVLLILIGAIAVYGIYGPEYDASSFIYFQF